MKNKPIQQIPELIHEIYSVVAKLEALFPGRRFTPDGHLVGSIGEVLASYAYGLDLLSSSHEGHDARAHNGRLVQIKATQVKSIGLSSRPRHLLVLQIQSNGTFLEIYNGPGEVAWNAAGKMQKNGQRPISVSRLVQLMQNIPAELTLERVDS